MSDLLGLMRERGVEAKAKGGGEWCSPCPGCGGTDRFCVWPDEGVGGRWWCRGCEQTGDDMDFAQAFLGFSFGEAVRRCGRTDLGEYVQDGDGGARPYRRRVVEPYASKPARSTFAAREASGPVAMWRERAEALVGWAHEQIWAHDAVLAWLEKRGLDADAVRAFRLGWNPGERGRDMYRAQTAWGLPDEKPNGKPRRLWIPRGLVVPVLVHEDGAQVIERVKIRRPKGKDGLPSMYETVEAGPEWARQTPFVQLRGGGVRTCVINPEARVFVIVEAELDGYLVAAACERAGLGDGMGGVGVVPLGSASMRPDAAAWPILQGAMKILVGLDFDAPDPDGNRPGAAAAQWWLKNLPQAQRWPVPEGKDPGEFHEMGGDVAAWIHEGLPPIMTVKAEPPRREALLAPQGGAAASPKRARPAALPIAVEVMRGLCKGTPVRIVLGQDGSMAIGGIERGPGAQWWYDPANAERKARILDTFNGVEFFDWAQEQAPGRIV